jgi:hypothetical protein
MPDMALQEMCLFLAVALQLGHDQRDTLSDYWLTLEQYFTGFYRNTDRFYYVLRILHFSDSKIEPDKTDENYDRPWKMRAITISSVIHMLNITVGPDI